MKSICQWWFSLLLLGTAPSMLAAESSAQPGILLREGLLIQSVARSGRSAFHTDAIEAALVSGQWSAPRPGETVVLPDGTSRTWEAVVADEKGAFSGAVLRGGYACIPYVAERDEVLLLKASGHSLVYVNGEPRVGAPYRKMKTVLPVRLHAGTNDLLFQSGRGDLRVELQPPTAPVTLATHDLTLPDLIVNQENDHWGALLVVNSTTNLLTDLKIVSVAAGGTPVTTRLPSVLPLSVRKVGFRLKHSGQSDTNRIEFEVTLSRGEEDDAQVLDSVRIPVRLREAWQTHKRTFISDIDGSVQYFAVTPARPLDADHPAKALVLSLHGAAVEALGHAASYKNKTWATIAAPTNRRPFGFDWEDWGRMDALEVLAIAQEAFCTDPHQTYLSGHSMGGHGTWQIGVNYPDRFAALGPSAGWISFFSYAGGRRSESTNALAQLIQRASTPSDTLVMKSNYLHEAIYVLHGDADDNVPVTQARTMRTVLEGFHHDFLYHEQPGAGHWWGDPCVDWPPMFDLFARHKIPDSDAVREINFTTANPGISASCHWVTIEAQQRALDKSVVDVRWDPATRRRDIRIAGTTENVARLSMDVAQTSSSGPFLVELDGQTLTNVSVFAGESRLWFVQDAGGWRQSHPVSPASKGPHRCGPFKEAFQHRMQFVYGTRGTPQENAWALLKARYDAETWWYRGNGSVDVLPDTAFDPRREPDRGVILYGHADSNGAWDALLGDSPVQVKRGRVVIGGRTLSGEDLACLFLRPRPGSDVACVGVVAGSGLTGMRLTDRAPYFTSGVAYPDCTVFDPTVLSQGADAARVAGFFGNDWSVEQGEFAWRDDSPR
jgi:pimeloyl-ACP methyl ester carboxylesterase